MTEQAERAIEIIKAVRDLDSFTAKKVRLLTGIPSSTTHLLIKLMHENGIISLYGKVKCEKHYKVSSNAIQQVKEIFTELMPSPYDFRDKPETTRNPMVIVNKANVKGMGSPVLNRLDSLLTRARA